MSSFPSPSSSLCLRFPRLCDMARAAKKWVHARLSLQVAIDRRPVRFGSRSDHACTSTNKGARRFASSLAQTRLASVVHGSYVRMHSHALASTRVLRVLRRQARNSTKLGNLAAGGLTEAEYIDWGLVMCSSRELPRRHRYICCIYWDIFGIGLYARREVSQEARRRRRRPPMEKRCESN